MLLELNKMSIMPTIIKQKGETRGRPKKNEVKALSGTYRKTFTQHMCVTYGLSLMYVMEIWAPTKDQKRIGHSEGAFTVYEKISDKYCYFSYASDIEKWGFKLILKNPQLNKFCKTLIGSAPNFVLRQLLLIVEQFLQLKEKQSAKFALNQLRKNYLEYQDEDGSKLDEKFKYLRFSKIAVAQMKSEKWADTIAQKVRQLWPIFIDIYSYCIYCAHENIENNKFMKALFSDASNPEDTLIGQLSLNQIMSETERQHFEEYPKKSEVQNQSFTLFNRNRFGIPKEVMKNSPYEMNSQPKISSFNTTVSSFNSINLNRKIIMPIIITGGRSSVTEKSKKVDRRQSYLSVSSLLSSQKEKNDDIQFQPVVFRFNDRSQSKDQDKHWATQNNTSLRVILQDNKLYSEKNSQKESAQLSKKDSSMQDKIKKEQEELSEEASNQIQNVTHNLQNTFKAQMDRRKNVEAECKNRQFSQNQKQKQQDRYMEQQAQQKNDTKINLANLLGSEFWNDFNPKQSFLKGKNGSQDNIATGKTLQDSRTPLKRMKKSQKGNSQVSIEQEGCSNQDKCISEEDMCEDSKGKSGRKKIKLNQGQFL